MIKKYQQSKWYKGLLEAEDYEKRGFTASVSGASVAHKKEGEMTYLLLDMYESQGERLRGMRDYIEYKQSVLDKVNE